MRRFASSSGHLPLASLLLLSCSALAKNNETNPAGPTALPAQTRGACSTKLACLQALFARANLPFPAPRLYLRAFKAEGELELWAGAQDRAPLRLIKVYPICASSGVLGPKRRQGDGQVPEGFYELTRFQRHTRFHRSMLINYPNRLDRRLGRTGGAILIHGKCVTIGCIPIEDGPVEELFEATLASRRRYSGVSIPIHIFPLRMSQQGVTRLQQLARGDEELWAFWRDLLPAYTRFEKTHRLPRVKVTADGRYQLARGGGRARPSTLPFQELSWWTEHPNNGVGR